MAQSKQKDLFKKDPLRAYLTQRKETSKKPAIPTKISTNMEQMEPEVVLPSSANEMFFKHAIQIASDIHLEFPNVLTKMPKIKAKAPILALLGDIGYPHSKEYQQFIKQCASKFKHVILIAGNHEYYTSSVDTVHSEMTLIANLYPNVHFLQCKTLELPDIIPNTIILGCTLWTKFEEQYQQKAAEQINDYTWISTDKDCETALTVTDTNGFYDQHLSFIHAQCEWAKRDKKNVIILTHHAPTDYKCIDPHYFNEISYLMNFSNVEQLFQPPVVAWCFGHTHFNMDILVKCDLKEMREQNEHESSSNEQVAQNNDVMNPYLDTELMKRVDQFTPDKNQSFQNKYDAQQQQDIDGDPNNEEEEKKTNEDEIWYVRVATNQQGYLHRKISDGYLLHKVITFPIKPDKEDIEVIDYSRIVTLPILNKLNQI